MRLAFSLAFQEWVWVNLPIRWLIFGDNKGVHIPNITIIGTGSLASLFAARLAPYAQITMLGSWPAALSAINQNGLTLLDATTEIVRKTVTATSNPVAVAPSDYVLILVKAWQTERAAKLIPELLAPDGLVITLQNGIGNADQLAVKIDPAQIVTGITTQGANMHAPGVVQAAGAGVTQLASTPQTLAKLTQLQTLFNMAGLETSLTENLASVMWEKLIINCGINALTAILRCPNGMLLEKRPARELMEKAALEAFHVAQAQGITIRIDPVLKVQQVAQATAANRSSMLQDITRGAPTEIEAINGAVVRLGCELGVDVRTNIVLTNLVRAL